MAVSNVYRKSANFSIVRQNFEVIENFNYVNIEIPVSLETKESITNIFRSCRGEIFSADGILLGNFPLLLSSIGAEYCRFPTLEYFGNKPVNITSPYASFYYSLFPSTPIIRNSPYTAAQLFISHNGSGFTGNTGSTGDSFKNGNDYLLPDPRGAQYFGIYRQATSPSDVCGVGLHFITSDGYFVNINLYVNGNNSTISFYNYNDSQTIISWIESLPGMVTPDDPYNPGGGEPGWNYSGTDPIGGGGDFNNTSDPIPEPTVPTISAVDCGFVTLYNPTLQQLNDLSAYMWSPLFTVETLKKIFADPMDIILGLMIVPVDVPAGTTQEVTVGGFLTGVQMTVAGAQYIEKDCGSITFTPFFGSYLDYSPYTKIQLFLPYIGTVEMNPDELIGRTVNIKYIVDIATGACTAFVRVTGATGRATHSSLLGPLYSFAGQCCQPVPVTGTNWNQLISSVVQVATTAISAGVGAAGAAAAAAAATQVGSDLTPTFAGQNIGDTSIPYREEVGSFKPVSRLRTSTGEGQSFIPSMINEPEHLSTAPDRGSNASPLGLTTATDAIAGLVNSVMSGKISVGHSGSLSSVSGMIGIKTPFFIITRPNLTLAETYRELHGYPANATQNFADLSGFTRVEGCRLNNMSCLTPELNEIYGWLKEGVVF